MALGTGAVAALAGSGVAAGGGILSSVIGANASGDAGDRMAGASYLAGLAAQNNYGDQLKMMAPWLTAGSMGVNTLANLMGTAAGLTKAKRPMTQEEYIQTLTDPMERHMFKVQLALGGNFEDLVPADKRMVEEWTGTPTNPLSQENYQKSPYYNFLQTEGVKARERGAAARGGQFSGAEAKALTEFGQNLAAQDFSDWQNNWLKSLSPWFQAAGLGQTQVNQASNLGTSTAGQYGNYLVQGASSQAAGNMGQANTWIPAIQWAGQQGGNLLTQYGPQWFGGNQAQTTPSQGVYPGWGNYPGAAYGG